MVDASLVPYLFAIALFVPSGAFIAVGHFYIGDMKSGLREIGVLTLFTGIIQVITIIFLLSLNAGFDAMTVVPLAYTWLVMGITVIMGLPSFKPLADMLMTLVAAYVLEASYFWAVAHALVLGTMVLSYAIVVLLLVLNTYGKIGPKPAGYLLIAEGVLTVFIPAMAFWFGIPFS